MSKASLAILAAVLILNTGLFFMGGARSAEAKCQPGRSPGAGLYFVGW